jgi:FtsZ-binding cell division protein ZapB
MTWEEMEGTMAFIVEQQAQINVTIDRLSEKVNRNSDGISALLAMAEIQASEIRDLTESTRGLTESTSDLRESTQALAERRRESDERGRRTDERLDALINIVERHVSEGRNGKSSAPGAGGAHQPKALGVGLPAFGLGLEPAGDADAGDGVAGGDFAEVGVDAGAVGDGLGAAGVEAAAGGRVDGRGHVALEDDAVALVRGVGDGDGGEQGARVGVERVGVQLLGRGHLDDAAEVHDGHAVGDVLDDGEAVRDEEVGEVELALQVFQKVDDLRLHAHVERGDGLVGHDELRVQGERPRDADALALPAGELVRVAVYVVGV